MAQSPANELIQALPISLKRRFQSAPELIRYYLTETARAERIKTKDDAAITQTVQFLALVWMIDRFLRRGTTEARRTIAVLKDAGIAGFSVGSSQFDQDGEATVRGERLSEALREAVLQANFPIDWLIALDSYSVSDAVWKIRGFVLHGQSLD
jgi:hypothetical protein